jgi:hypothetical protein
MNILLFILLLLSSGNHLFASQIDTTTNAPFVSMYGDLEAEPRLDALSVQFQYGIQSSVITSTLLNGGTATTSSSLAVLATSGTAGAVAGLQTKTNLQYRSGHQADAYFTVAFTGTIAANTKQYIGALDSNNGFGVGFNGTSFGIVVRKNGTDTFTAQSNFNGDKIDGTGSSGFNYNYTLLNVFHIAYGWLGASPIQFQVMSSSGSWITFHSIQYPNSAATPSIANALLPISAQVYDPSGGNSLQLKTASWNMDIVGIQSNVANRFFGINATRESTTSELFTLMIKNSETFNGQPNRMNLQLQRYYECSVDDVNPSSTTIVYIYKNATVTGTSFSSVNSNSVVSYSTAGTYSAGTGTLLIAQTLVPFGNQPEFIDITNFNFLVYPGETITITTRYAGGIFDPKPDIMCGLNWAELF